VRSVTLFENLAEQLPLDIGRDLQCNWFFCEVLSTYLCRLAETSTPRELPSQRLICKRPAAVAINAGTATVCLICGCQIVPISICRLLSPCQGSPVTALRSTTSHQVCPGFALRSCQQCFVARTATRGASFLSPLPGTGNQSLPTVSSARILVLGCRRPGSSVRMSTSETAHL
jgi:hypothetical protein